MDGLEVSFYTLTSFSEDLEKAKFFAGPKGIILRLLPAQDDLVIMPISHLSAYPDEEEWLLAALYRFRLTKSEEGYFDLTLIEPILEEDDPPSHVDLSTLGIRAMAVGTNGSSS